MKRVNLFFIYVVLLLDLYFSKDVFAEEPLKRAQPQVVLNYAQKMKQNAQKAELHLKFLELQAGKYRGAMGSLAIKIAENEKKISSLTEELRIRVVDIYKFGSTEEFNLLLSVENTHEAIVAAYLLERISRQRQNVMEDLLKAKEDLEASKNSLEWNRRALNAQVREIKLLKEKYDGLGSRASMAVKREGLRENEKKNEASSLSSEELGAVVARYRNREHIREHIEENNSPIQPVFNRNLHLLDWPVVGPLAGLYGNRVHPIKKTREFNSGIDIRAASKTTVKAAFGGKIFFAARHRSLGSIVMIDHGANISTVYAHLSSLLVKEGERVKTGAPIGVVGSLGGAKGNGVHFEVRSGATPQNPLEYLRRF